MNNVNVNNIVFLVVYGKIIVVKNYHNNFYVILIRMKYNVRMIYNVFGINQWINV